MPLYALVTYIQLYGPRDAMNGKVSHFVTSGGAAGKLIVVIFLSLFQGTLASWSHQVSRQFVPLHNFALHLLASDSRAGLFECLHLWSSKSASPSIAKALFLK